MRKSRANIIVSESGLESLLEDPLNFFDVALEEGILLPKWSSFIFCAVNLANNKMVVFSFEGEEDYIVQYSKAIMKMGDDWIRLSFAVERGAWKLFLPPTVVGTNLVTKLRRFM